MRTPEEIKRGLECCMKAGFQPGSCKVCPYYDEGIHDCAGVLGKDILQYIQQLEAQVHRWIPVEERLPEKNEVVIVCCDDGFIDALIYRDGRFRYQGAADESVTHWMPLPERTEEVVEQDEDT